GTLLQGLPFEFHPHQPLLQRPKHGSDNRLQVCFAAKSEICSKQNDPQSQGENYLLFDNLLIYIFTSEHRRDKRGWKFTGRIMLSNRWFFALMKKCFSWTRLTDSWWLAS